MKGSLAEREDFWTLCYDSEAAYFYVEHEWDHMNPYKLGAGESSRGTARVAADDGNGEGVHEIAAAKARLLEKARA